MPIAHGEGNYFADEPTLDALEGEGRVVFRYCDDQGAATSAANPNGSRNNIAGVFNETGNVLGLMPHPETLLPIRRCRRTDGANMFAALVESLP